MSDYTGLSQSCLIFSVVDDFSGECMIRSMVPKEYLNVTGGLLVFKRFSRIGAGSVVLVNIKIGEGAVIGAMSFVNKTIEVWCIYAVIAVKRIKN